MKNKSIKTILFIFVVSLSLASYTYLNSITIPNSTGENEMSELEVDEISNKSESIFSDVKILERSINFLKNMLPISQ